ncbi:MAG: hypothetical protein AAFV90_24300 [Cyanobacteria bacterium J06634_5]
MIYQHGEGGSIHQVAGNLIKNTQLILFSDGNIEKRIDDYEFFIDNWDRIEDDQVEIISTYIESSAELFNRYKHTKEKFDLDYYFNVFFLWMVVIIGFLGPFAIFGDTEVQAFTGDKSLIIHTLFSPFASALANSPEIPEDVKTEILQYFMERPEGLQIIDFMVIAGWIVSMSAIFLLRRAKRKKKRKVSSLKRNLETQLMMTRRLYSLLSYSKKQSLKQMTFRYPNPYRLGTSYYGEHFVEVTWDELKITRWLREEFKD